jgi:hypothetical protein
VDLIMRIIGLLAVTFLIMLLVGRVYGRDALLFISLACNLIVLALRIRAFFATRERGTRS